MADATRESKIVKKIREHLELRGWLVWKNHGSGYSAYGLPDLMGVKDGRLIAIEVKNQVRVVTPAQAAWMRRLKRKGAIAGVARSIDDVEKLLEEQ